MHRQESPTGRAQTVVHEHRLIIKGSATAVERLDDREFREAVLQILGSRDGVKVTAGKRKDDKYLRWPTRNTPTQPLRSRLVASSLTL